MNTDSKGGSWDVHRRRRDSPIFPHPRWHRLGGWGKTKGDYYHNCHHSNHYIITSHQLLPLIFALLNYQRLTQTQMKSSTSSGATSHPRLADCLRASHPPLRHCSSNRPWPRICHKPFDVDWLIYSYKCRSVGEGTLRNELHWYYSNDPEWLMWHWCWVGCVKV